VKPLVTDVETTRELLGNTGRNKIYQLINAGELESIKVGKLRRIVVASIHAYIARKVAAERMHP
jgi:excisionase family DNA binding protein